MMTEKERIKKSIKANDIIKNHMIWSMGAGGLIPIPIADVFAVSAIQIDMIRQLSKHYGVDFKETEGKAIITSLTSSSAARLSARLFKFVPVIGQTIGGITVAIMSGASTYALGEVFKKHFETGGTFLDFNPENIKKFYQEKFKDGQKMAKKIKKDKNAPIEIVDKGDKKSVPNDEIVDRLKELMKLKEAGVLSDVEFDIMKKRIIPQE